MFFVLAKFCKLIFLQDNLTRSCKANGKQDKAGKVEFMEKSKELLARSYKINDK